VARERRHGSFSVVGVRRPIRILLPLLALLLPACAHLGGLAALIPLRIEAAEDREAQLQLLPPSTRHPLGGAGVRLWARIVNPNPFGVTLSHVDGTLFLDDIRATTADLPLGLPLGAGEESVVPIDLSIGFGDLPALRDLVSRALGRGSVPYQLRGSFTIDAGTLGQPSFGPMLLLEGELRAR
jgi:hypothetical protein